MRIRGHFSKPMNGPLAKNFGEKNRMDFFVNETEELVPRTRMYVVRRTKVLDFNSGHCQGPHLLGNPALFLANGYNNNNNNNNNNMLCYKNIEHRDR